MCHQERCCATASLLTKSRTFGSGHASAISNHPRGIGPRCDNRIVCAIKSASSACAGRIVALTTAPRFLIEHDLRANAFRVCREGKPLHTFPDHALGGWPEAHQCTGLVVIEFAGLGP